MPRRKRLLPPKPPRRIPHDQRWFWTPEWQAKEKEAEEDLAAGRYTEYSDVDELLADLCRVGTHKILAREVR